MLTFHVVLSFLGLLVGAMVLVPLCRGRRQPAWDAVLLTTTALISITGFPLPSPPGTPTPDPARVLGVIELIVVAAAAFAIYAGHVAGGWRATYIVSMVLAVYLNYFVAVVQAFQKVAFLHALAPAGKEPPFLIAQTVTVVSFVAIGVIAFRRFRAHPPRLADAPVS